MKKARLGRSSMVVSEIGISSATLAIAWSKQHDFVASTIVGANTLSNWMTG